MEVIMAIIQITLYIWIREEWCIKGYCKISNAGYPYKRSYIVWEKKCSNLLKSVVAEEINQMTLSMRLTEVKNGGIFNRKFYSVNPTRIEYLITKKGRILRPVLEQMAAYSLSYCSDSVFEDTNQDPLKKL
jgi:DNA-binding HxlR family transcriptional regulator